MKVAPTWVVNLGLAISLAHPVQTLQAQQDNIPSARQTEIISLLRQDCGACHGLTLEGGLGPPLLARNLAKKPAAWLRQIILDGIPGTAMPPWRPFLSEAEVKWLVTALQKGIDHEQ